MKFLSVVLLSLAGLAAARGDRQANSTTGMCRQVARLTRLMDLANNQTKLDKVTQNNATKAAEIKAKAAAEASTLSTLQANATLMSECSKVFAAGETRKSCAQMARLQRLEKLVANATALAEATKNNATKAAELQAKAKAEAGTLASLQANATLGQLCAVERTKQTCRAMTQLQKVVNQAANSTFLNDRFKGNQTKIAAFQARAAKAQTKLAAMQGNSTLTSACSALTPNGKLTSAEAAKASTNTTSSPGGSASGTKSAAGSIQPVAGIISLAAMLSAGLALL